MNITRVFGIMLAPGTEDSLELFLSGRFSEIGKMRLDPGQVQESREKYRELENLVMEYYPGAREERERFLNWLAGHVTVS